MLHLEGEREGQSILCSQETKADGWVDKPEQMASVLRS